MKSLAAFVLSLITFNSFAEQPEAAGFQNNVNGWTIIVNRDHYCGARGMRDGYAFGDNLFIRFCWIQRGKAILAVLENGETRAWPVDSFEFLAAEPEINNNKL